jgi:hypothetical protein
MPEEESQRVGEEEWRSWLPKTRGQPPKWPWRLLNIGDSFYVPAARLAGRHYMSFYTMTYATARRLGIKLRVRKEADDKGEPGFRVSRIE